MKTKEALRAINKSVSIGRTVFLIHPSEEVLTDLLIASTNCRLSVGVAFWGATAEGKVWRVHTKGNH